MGAFKYGTGLLFKLGYSGAHADQVQLVWNGSKDVEWNDIKFGRQVVCWVHLSLERAFHSNGDVVVRMWFRWNKYGMRLGT